MPKRMRFPVQTLPIMFLSAVLANCAGDKGKIAAADEAPAATGNVGQVAVVEARFVKTETARSTN